MEIRHSLVATVLIVAGITSAVGGWYVARTPGIDSHSDSIGAFLGDLELPVVDGGVDGPARRVGDVVVLDFWASWCSPCHVQSRLLGGLVDDYADRGVRFFAVNVGESESVVRSSLLEHPITFPVLMDSSAESSSRAEVFGLPTVVILDRTGAVALRRVGLTSERMLRGSLDDVLASSTPRPGASSD